MIGICGPPGASASDGSNLRESLQAFLLIDSTSTTMSSPAVVTILYFAAASTATGLTTEEIILPSSTDPFKLSSLSALLVSRHPGKGLDKVLETSQWSVDAEMVEDAEEVVLKGGEEVAVICPVSGG